MRTLIRALVVLVAVLIVKVALLIVLGYRDYFPPNFETGFLVGRQSYFFGPYLWAFYAHIVSGPPTLLIGLALLSDRLRQRWPAVHRGLGKLQVALVLALLTPSGLWMARHAESGPIAATGFSWLALLTAATAWLGWRRAVSRRFADHRRWMLRCYLLICSAVTLRLIGGLAFVSGIPATWSYPFAAWASWLVPLTVWELGPLVRAFLARRFNQPTTPAAASATR